MIVAGSIVLHVSPSPIWMLNNMHAQVAPNNGLVKEYAYLYTWLRFNQWEGNIQHYKNNRDQMEPSLIELICVAPSTYLFKSVVGPLEKFRLFQWFSCIAEHQ